MKNQFVDWIYQHLGEDFGGNPNPPGSTQRLEFGEYDDNRRMYIATTDCNDGHELWIGFHHKWLFHCEAKYARQLARFILWDWWIKSTWCGLKRRIWYMALHRLVVMMQQPPPPAH